MASRRPVRGGFSPRPVALGRGALPPGGRRRCVVLAALRGLSSLGVSRVRFRRFARRPVLSRFALRAAARAAGALRLRPAPRGLRRPLAPLAPLLLGLGGRAPRAARGRLPRPGRVVRFVAGPPLRARSRPVLALRLAALRARAPASRSAVRAARAARPLPRCGPVGGRGPARGCAALRRIPRPLRSPGAGRSRRVRPPAALVAVPAAALRPRRRLRRPGRGGGPAAAGSRPRAGPPLRPANLGSAEAPPSPVCSRRPGRLLPGLWCALLLARGGRVLVLALLPLVRLLGRRAGRGLGSRLGPVRVRSACAPARALLVRPAAGAWLSARRPFVSYGPLSRFDLCVFMCYYVYIDRAGTRAACRAGSPTKGHGRATWTGKGETETDSRLHGLTRWSYRQRS